MKNNCALLLNLLLLCLWLIHGTESFEANGVVKYEKQLQPYFDKVQAKQLLTEEETTNATEIASSYYTFLKNQNIPYGALAKDVVKNEGPYARIANSYLITRGKAEGKSEKELETIKNNLKVALAYQDARIRSQLPPDSNGSIPYRNIADYHYDAFKDQGLSKYAWGGALFEEFAGSGSWMNFGGYDKNVEVKKMELIKAILFNKEVEGVKAYESLKTIVKNSIASFDNMGDYWKVLFSSDKEALENMVEVQTKTTTTKPEKMYPCCDDEVRNNLWNCLFL